MDVSQRASKERSDRLSGRTVKPLVVVGIPAFNEENTIAKIVLKAQEFAQNVIVCDDGSTDLTGKIARRLGADVVRHDKNLGYGAAIHALFKRAKELNADVFVTLDGDGQHDPSEIPNVVKPIIDGQADVVIGSRFTDAHRPGAAMPWLRRVGVKFITRLVNNSSKHRIGDAQSGFRAYGRRPLEALKVFESGMGASVEILMSAKKEGFRILEIPSSVNYDNNGAKTSTYNPVWHGVDVFMSIVKLIVEEKPLTLLGVPGITFLCVGAVFGAWMLQIYGAEHRIVTNIALASIAFVLIGFFLLSTGITLYAISRLAERTNGKK